MADWVADPSEVNYYGNDWGAGTLTSGETLTASTWTVQTGITQTTPSPSFTSAGVTMIYLTGGTVGTTYSITNHVTTSAGRQFDWTRTIQIIDR